MILTSMKILHYIFRSADQGIVTKTAAASLPLNGGYSSSSDGEQKNSSKATTVVNASTSNVTTNRNKNQKPRTHHAQAFVKNQITSKIDTGMSGRPRPNSAPRSISLGRKNSPANKQVITS